MERIAVGGCMYERRRIEHMMLIEHPAAEPASNNERYRDPHTASPRLDSDIFLSLCAAQVTPLYRYFYHQLGHRQDAEDLVASTIDKALASRAHFDPARGTPPAWLFGIARHTLRDFQRRQRPQVSLTTLDPPLVDGLLSPDIQAIHAEEAQALHVRVRHLPIGQREAVTLYYFGALSAREVALVLGRSEGAVRLLIHRALTSLRAQYCEEERA